MTNKLSNCTFIFSHGAGAGIESEFIQAVGRGLKEAGVTVLFHEFPYMKKIKAEGKRRPPDRMPKLIESFEDAVQSTHLDSNQQVFIGGKSMGGRVASLVATDTEFSEMIKGVICLGFPFHPPKKPEKYRGEHLRDISTPTLILQGERDTFGTRLELNSFEFSDQVHIEFVCDGDHSFKPRVKSGCTLTQNVDFALKKMIHFMSSFD